MSMDSNVPVPFKDSNYAIEANLGRPRTVLAIGSRLAETISTANSRGARVVALEFDPVALTSTRDCAAQAYAFGPAGDDAGFRALGDNRFDLAILEAVPEAELEAVLRRVPEFLTDGGHVLVTARNRSEAHARVLAALQAAGLELLRTDLNSRIGKAVSVALGWNKDVQNLADLKKSYTTPLRFTHDVLRPVEKLVSRALPQALVDEFIFVARKPPRRGKLSLTVGMLSLNEKESVERMIDDIRAVAPDAKILLIDSSSDETPELAKAKGARVVRQLPPRGHGPAMERLMYEAASESDALIYLDCDFTYPTAMITKIREMLEEGADVVNASRTAKYPEAMPVPNFIANRTFAAAARVVHGVPTTDVHSGMRGYRASVIRGFSFSGEGDALPLDTLILPARSNYHVIEFAIPYAERVGFSKLAKMRGTIWTFIRIATAVGKGTRVRSGRRYVHR